MNTRQVTVTEADGFQVVSNAADFLAVNNGSTTIYACFSDTPPVGGQALFPVNPGVGLVRNGLTGDLYSTAGSWAVTD